MTYKNRHENEKGAVSGLLIAAIAFGVLTLVFGVLAIWAYVSYTDASSGLDDKIAIAQAQAKEDQANADETKYAEREKQPTKTFKAPDDYCGLTFQYPRTWSVYESEQITNGGDFKAYMNPDVVPPISSSQQYALRVLIEQKDYDSVTNQYNSLVQKGDLKQATTTSQGNEGMRLTGNFSKNIRGDAVIYRCRDKTISIFTDADTFKSDFESVIRTIDYNS